jgi:Ca2+:H+ antiporter
MLNWLLLFVPVAIGLEFFAPGSHTPIFLCSCLAIVPLAACLGRATEELAAHTGEGIGGLLNATFGNAAELIIAFMALRKGLYSVVKASLTGSILGNILLVLGAAILAGGIRHKEQRFNATAAREQATLLLLAAIALVVPAGFHHLVPDSRLREDQLSLAISIVLLASYATHLLFSLGTHRHHFTGDVHEPAVGNAPWPLAKAVLVLGVSTAFIAWISEILVGSVEAAAAAFGFTEVFLGVIVVAVVGNAAEHSSAVIMALKNRMELSFSIAAGSSIQIALFVAPLLVLVSRFAGPRPMDLVFTAPEVLAVFLAVLITAQISADGESNWLEGAQLLAVYLILGIVFYYLPEPPEALAR